MKTNDQIDAIMAAIPASWRTRWCGGEYGACSCLGCVQIGNRAVILGKATGKAYLGDPEYISEVKLREFGTVYTEHKITREEWESWMSRRPSSTPTDAP